MNTVEFTLKHEHIALCDLLKVSGLANSGAQGKHLVAEGKVKVDRIAETRKSAKIRAGQTVECSGTLINVLAP